MLLFAEFINVLKSTFTSHGGNNHSGNYDKVCYVDAYAHDYISTFFPRLLFAKGLLDSGKVGKVVVLTKGHNDDLYEICRTLGYEVKYIDKKNNLFKAMLYSIKWYLFNRNNNFDNICISDIPCADYLADYIIRNKADLFNVSKIRLWDLRLSTSFTLHFINIRDFFEKDKPYIFVVNETGYWFGAVIKLAEKLNSQLIQCTAGNRMIVFGEKIGLSQCPASLWRFQVEEALKEIDKKHFDYISWADSYFENRSKGLTDNAARVAYADKNEMDRKTWIKINGVNPNKKNIIIMAHCFSDCANTSTDKSVFKNYYEWLIGTLNIIKDIDNVNWILRAHPSRHVYHEGDAIYEIFNRYKKDNIYVLEDTISSNTVLQIADAVITVLGTCGMEYPAHGIPAICAGASMYGHLGLTVDPENYEEYKGILSHLDTIKPLSEDTIDKAKKVSCAYFTLNNTVDRLDKHLMEAYKYPLNDGNTTLLRMIINDYHNNLTLKDSIFYMQGTSYSKGGKRCLAITQF